MKGEEKKQFYGQGLDNLMVTTLPRVMQLNQRHCNKKLGSTYPRTATEMDGILHTDFQKIETSRDIKRYF